MKRVSALERFEMKFVKGSEAECWSWLAAKTPKGYGKLMVDTETKVFEVAHRFSYKQYVGEIPEGFVVRHKCDNPSCVNPYHLELGTDKDNVHDCIKRGRFNAYGKRKKGSDKTALLIKMSRGENNSGSKLTDEQVEEIRQLRKGGMTVEYIAEKFNVSSSYVSKICRHAARNLATNHVPGFVTNKSQGVGDARKKVTEEMKEQVLALTKKGKTHRETADIVGLSQAHVTTILKKLNGGKLQKPRIPEETVQKIKELRLTGMSFARIGESLNLSKATVQTIVKRVMDS